MSSDIINRLRLIPRSSEFLDRTVGSSGEIFYNVETNSIRAYSGKQRGGFELARSDLANVDNSVFLSKANEAGISGGGGGSFELKISADDDIDRVIDSGLTLRFTGSGGIITSSQPNGVVTFANTSTFFNSIAVSGQSNVVAQSQNSTLELVAGSNVFLSTDPTNNSILISAVAGEGSTSNSFEIIEVSGQSNIVANTPSSVLTVEAGSNVSITTNPSTRTLTISSSAASGVDNFNDLTDVASASLTIDQIYLPAITSLTVGNVGASAYLFDQYAGNNPTIYAISGTTIAFKINASGHPLLIQNAAGNNFDTGLVHVSTTGVVTTGSAAQGKDSGTLYWKVPFGISGGYRYQCQFHGPMVGSIVVKDIAII